MNAMRQDYQSRIDELEARLAKAESEAAAAHAAADAAQANAPQAVAADTSAPPVELATAETPPAAPASSNSNIYNPGIAVALNGFFNAARKDTGDDRIAGVATGDAVGRPARGFSLGESEVSFAANIDPALAAFFDFSIGADNVVSLEEAYIRTTALPGGLTVKAGRFLSSIAYLNERHAHDWSFSDAPLPYRAFLNTQLGDDGVQLRWIAPTDQTSSSASRRFAASPIRPRARATTASARIPRSRGRARTSMSQAPILRRCPTCTPKRRIVSATAICSMAPPTSALRR